MKRVLFLIILTSLLYTTAGAQQPKPNILWITIEDTSPVFIGCYGNGSASTPNIDKLAGTGIRFTNAFSTNTVCSPSRTSIITGVPTYKTGTGHHRSKVLIPDFIKGFPFYLRQAGYYTTNNSKTDYNISNEKAFINDAWNESSNSAGWRNRKAGQPFFSVFNYMDSHQSRTMTWPYEKYKQEVLDNLSEKERIGDDQFEVPPVYRESPEMRKHLARVYNSLKLTDNKIGELLKSLEKDHLIDSTIIFIFGDHGEGIPRGKTNGIGFGYRIPFIIHIPPMYQSLSPWKAGSVTNELVDFEDLAPTLISLSEGEMPDYMEGRVLMGKKRSVPGTYLTLSSDRSDNSPDLVRSLTDGRYLYSRNFMTYMPELRYINYMEIGEIKRQMRQDLAAGHLDELQKSFFSPRPSEFLFDLEQDPWEMQNLADKKEYREQLFKMRKELNRRILKSRDILFLPEYELSLLAEHGENAYNFRLDKKKYPFEKIYKAASLAGIQNNETADRQIELLDDSNKVVRYWAILGLMGQSNRVQLRFKDRLLRAIDDPYPPVSITAAALLFDLSNDANAVKILNKHVSGKDKDLALTAINYVLYLKNPDIFTKAIVSAYKNKATNETVRWACEDFLNSRGENEY